MSSFEHGRQAETAAADFLERKGCIIIARNWRTRWCEIDIIALRGEVVYFCEVKYRQTVGQGRGLDYITAGKLRQMQFAAEFWLSKHTWQHESQLCAIEVSGKTYRISGVIKDI